MNPAYLHFLAAVGTWQAEDRWLLECAARGIVHVRFSTDVPASWPAAVGPLATVVPSLNGAGRSIAGLIRRCTVAYPGVPVVALAMLRPGASHAIRHMILAGAAVHCIRTVDEARSVLRSLVRARRSASPTPPQPV